MAIVDGDSKTANGSWEPYKGYFVNKSRRSKLTDEPDIDIDRLRYSKDALCDVAVTTLPYQRISSAPANNMKFLKDLHHFDLSCFGITTLHCFHNSRAFF